MLTKNYYYIKSLELPIGVMIMRTSGGKKGTG